jgi:predicted O-methyltransferase YrrM
MFKNIPKPMLARMEHLEAVDERDRTDGTEHMKRLRQVPRITGKFIGLLASLAPAGEYVEVGTSAGYSSLWLWMALKGRGIRHKTYEILPEKAALARETFRLAGVSGDVELIEGDFLERGGSLANIAFCFVDCEKHFYESIFRMVAGKMVPGGLLAADNAISHQEEIKGMLDTVEADDRFDSLIVPVGQGVLVCRRV